MTTNAQRFKRLPGRRQRQILDLLIRAHESGFPGLPVHFIADATGNKNAWLSIASLIRIGVLEILPSNRIAIVDPPAEVLEPQPNVIDFFVVRNRKARQRREQAAHAA